MTSQDVTNSDENESEPTAPGFTPGDITALRSGGPLVTVSEVRGDRALCIWFSSDEQLSTAEIPLVCLEPAGSVDYEDENEDFDMDYGDDEDAGKKKKKKKKRDDE